MCELSEDACPFLLLQSSAEASSGHHGKTKGPTRLPARTVANRPLYVRAHVCNPKKTIVKYSLQTLVCSGVFRGSMKGSQRAGDLIIEHWDHVITFAVEVRFQIRIQFWIAQPKLHETMYLFFCKT